MQVKLKQISIKNFKGIENAVIDFDGKDTEIRGDNATGKTTIYDAYLWCLFGKDSQDRTDFEILPMNNKDATAEVEVTLDIDGQDYAFKRTYSRKYTKNKDLLDFTGHKIKYFINDVPKKATEFKRAVENIAKEKDFKTLSNPLFFNEILKWNERRAILMSLTDVKDSDIILANDDFSELAEPLQKWTPDEYKKKLKSDLRKINDELKEIPARIDELQQSVMEFNIDTEAVSKEIETIKKQIKNLQARKENTQIKALQEQIKDLRTQKESRLNQIRDMIYQKQSEYYDLKAKLDRKNYLIDEIKRLEQEIETLRQDWKDTKNLQFTDDKCPYCGQKLPEHLLQDALKKFNLKKAKNLEKITQQGREKKAKLEEYKKELAEIENIDIKGLETEINELKEQLNQNMPEDEKIQELQERIEDLLENDDTDEQIKKLQNRLMDLQSKLAQVKVTENAKKRIEELKERERELAKEQNIINATIQLIEDFQQVKIERIESSINAKFKLVRFKLFNKLINGNIEETCEAMVDGVPYRNLNHGAKINAGLDIINTLQNVKNLYLPVWIDNREAVTKPLKIKSQVISLIVDEKYKKMEVLNHE